MIVNTLTGEIIDLKPLNRRPRGRVSRPRRSQAEINGLELARGIRDVAMFINGLITGLTTKR